MYICIYVYMYICVSVFMYICIYVYMHMYIYMYKCIYVFLYICIYVYLYICIYVYIATKKTKTRKKESGHPRNCGKTSHQSRGRKRHSSSLAMEFFGSRIYGIYGDIPVNHGADYGYCSSFVLSTTLNHGISHAMIVVNYGYQI